MWTYKSLSIFCVASLLGASARLGIGELFHGLGQNDVLPWAIFMANILGCFCFGLAWVYVQHKKMDARALLVGFMGSFTTFSSYAYDMYVFISQEKWAHLAIYGAGQVLISLVILHFGICCMQKVLSRAKR